MDNQEILKRLVDIQDRLIPMRLEFREYMDSAIEGFADHCYDFYDECYWRVNKSRRTRITRSEWYGLPPDKREPRDTEDVAVPPGGETGRYAREVDFCLNSAFAGLAGLIRHV